MAGEPDFKEALKSAQTYVDRPDLIHDYNLGVENLGAAFIKMREALVACVAAHYVGEGKVVCTDSLKPHLDRFVELLGKDNDGG